MNLNKFRHINIMIPKLKKEYTQNEFHTLSSFYAYLDKQHWHPLASNLSNVLCASTQMSRSS